MTNKQFLALTLLVMFATWEPAPDSAPEWIAALSALWYFVVLIAWFVLYVAAMSESRRDDGNLR